MYHQFIIPRENHINKQHCYRNITMNWKKFRNYIAHTGKSKTKTKTRESFTDSVKAFP